MAKNRIIWVDWAKSVCMFLVVLGHCHIQSSMYMITQVIYSFHIPLFFFISGLLCPKHFSKSTLLKDIRYIVVPYFVFGILEIIVNSILSREYSSQLYLSKIRFLFIGNDASIGAIWFLPSLFMCKQLYYILMRIGRNSIIAHTLLFILSLLPTYYIPLYNTNLPLFTDSALFGLPFFLLGSYCLSYIENKSHDNTLRISVATIVFLTLTIILSYYNGFVSIAICCYGSNLLLYYINALTGIATIIGACLLLRNKYYSFIIITSYGTIVTLGFHGIILLFLQYYIPVYAGFYTPSVCLPIAIIYASITYFICYILIIMGNHYCPQFLGLKGNLPTYIK